MLLVNCVDPKLEPLTVTVVPAAPAGGCIPVIVGAELVPVTVKVTPLLC